jgi:hypothetical protein
MASEVPPMNTSAPSLFLRNATGLVKGWSGFDAFAYSFMSVNLVCLGMFYSLAIFAYVPDGSGEDSGSASASPKGRADGTASTRPSPAARIERSMPSHTSAQHCCPAAFNGARDCNRISQVGGTFRVSAKRISDTQRVNPGPSIRSHGGPPGSRIGRPECRILNAFRNPSQSELRSAAARNLKQASCTGRVPATDAVPSLLAERSG